MAADFVGLLTLLILAALFASVTIEGSAAILGALFLFVGLGAVGLYVWHDSRAPTHPLEWAKIILLAPVWGGVVFVIDIAIGQIVKPSLGLIAGAMSLGSLGEATIFGAVSTGLIGIAGLFRSLFLQWHGSRQ